jgi:hypothetical protein
MRNGYSIKTTQDLQAEALEAQALMDECEQYRTGSADDDDAIDAWITKMMEAGIDPFEEVA